jgi:hypothetical protein
MAKKEEEKKEEKKPLDMTTDEAIEHLFGQETADKLREIAHGANPPPTSETNGLKAKSKSAQKHDNT